MPKRIRRIQPNKLSHRQIELLNSLSSVTWKRAPLLVRAATILSLQNRGLIEMRLPYSATLGNPYWCYADALLRLAPLGEQVKKVVNSKER